MGALSSKTPSLCRLGVLLVDFRKYMVRTIRWLFAVTSCFVCCFHAQSFPHAASLSSQEQQIFFGHICSLKRVILGTKKRKPQTWGFQRCVCTSLMTHNGLFVLLFGNFLLRHPSGAPSGLAPSLPTEPLSHHV